MNECKNCANIDNEYCFACDGGNQFKPITNADRIRAMTDEELAELFVSWIQDCGCNSVPCKNQCKKDWDSDEVKPCADYWLDWLKREETDG